MPRSPTWKSCVGERYSPPSYRAKGGTNGHNLPTEVQGPRWRDPRVRRLVGPVPPARPDQASVYGDDGQEEGSGLSEGPGGPGGAEDPGEHRGGPADAQGRGGDDPSRLSSERPQE